MTKNKDGSASAVLKKGYKVSSSESKQSKNGMSGLDMYMNQFPGALLPKTQIMGCEYRQKIGTRGVGIPLLKLPEGMNPSDSSLIRIWRPAVVIHCRKKRGNKVNETSSDVTASYDYYIHWEGTDRRLDCWLAWESLRVIPNDYLPLPHSKPNYETSNETLDEQTGLKLTHNALCIAKEDVIICEIPYYHDIAHDGMDEEYLKEHEELTKVKTIGKIAMGSYMVDTWYYSPYPKEVQNSDILYICEYCLSFFRYPSEYNRHQKGCFMFYPPGNELLRCNGLSMFEVDGRLARVYCENLCFLSKLFLDHKTLYNSVHLFLFYILTEYDENGYHIVGYFSKEKFSKNNLSCIMILPQYQRKGYGKYLINFSYCLSHLEQKPGSPERPLSDLGRVSYIAYWGYILLQLLIDNKQNVILSHKSDQNETSILGNSIQQAQFLATANQIPQRTTRSSTKQKDKKSAASEKQSNLTSNQATIIPAPKFITIQQLSEMTRIECSDILMTLNEFGLLKYLSNGESLVFLPLHKIPKILQKTGKPATQLHLSQFSYVSYEKFLASLECNLTP
ncbi:MOZ SAS family protein [Cryptosporidium andersoni]|uniref:Histone acetyltransferase n=1 Tax=Cryptosporidium andersoni TaxID=117008 RepID=A0A1J4MSR4_9CRYT|nr:MOZ SAS family protein [Cryptosporidium andersoni]